MQHIEIENPKTIERRAWLAYGSGLAVGLVLCGITIILVV
jgi:hypothetical protein